MKPLFVYPLFISMTMFAAEWRAGVAAIDITPDGPVWMSGYAARTKPSTGVLQPLNAKALALDDGRGGRAVIVTADLIGFSRPTADAIAAAAQKKWSLDRSQILFNASHTHTGPVVRPNLQTMYDLTDAQWQALDRYHATLVTKVTDVIGAALGDLQPARIEYHKGTAGFAINRRQLGAGKVRIGHNPGGPIDHSVPVLKVATMNGSLRAVLFGYACHNTTLTAEFYELSGDYAGFAQQEFERAHPGTRALFFIGAAGDQNPNPRSKLELAMQHGAALAKAVDEALATPGIKVDGRLRTAFQMTELPFAPRTREEFQNEANGPDKFKQRRAKAMLAAIDAGRPVRTAQYPMQGIAFGDKVALLGLGGEVVIDYTLAAKKMFPKHELMVAAYSNDVMCYIPNKRILAEGGYEADDSMIYYGMPGPFTSEVEDLMLAGIRKTLNRVGLK